MCVSSLVASQRNSSIYMIRWCGLSVQRKMLAFPSLAACLQTSTSNHTLPNRNSPAAVPMHLSGASRYLHAAVPPRRATPSPHQERQDHLSGRPRRASDPTDPARSCARGGVVRSCRDVAKRSLEHERMRTSQMYV